MINSTVLPIDVEPTTTLSSQQSRKTMNTMNQHQACDDTPWKPELFPYRMYDLLEAAEQDGFEEIISWLPDGKAFKIHSRLAFETKVLPVYFPTMTSYKSFRRQLNLYGIYQDRSMLNAPDNCKSLRPILYHVARYDVRIALTLFLLYIPQNNSLFS
jgi:hypothetical protein